MASMVSKDWWDGCVFWVTGPDGPGPQETKPFGTGFAIVQDGEAVLVVTCWHVVELIGPGRVHVEGNGQRVGPCALVSGRGDDDLDLAVIRVEGLRVRDPLVLAAPAVEGLNFLTYGFEPIGRPLAGALGQPLQRPHASNRPVPAWDYYLSDDARALEKVKDGYSGAPVYHPESGAVVAVLTHSQGGEKGLAIDIRNLSRVYSPAADWLRTIRVPAQHEYVKAPGALLAKILDHQAQIEKLKQTLSRPPGDKTLALVECASEDWPQDFADHLQWHFGGRAGGASPDEAVELDLGGRDDPRAFWDALVRAVPGPALAERPADIEAQRRLVRGWIGGPGLRVLSVPVNLRYLGWQLPHIVRCAHADLAALGALDPAAQVLVLFAAVRAERSAPHWWTWWVRPRLRLLGCCTELPALRALERPDLDDWHAAFPPALLPYYCRNGLKMELLALFGPGRSRVPHADARNLLIGLGAESGALQRARLPTRPY